MDTVLTEAKRLHDLGAAILWLHPKSKRPIESKWTTGPRASWDYLKKNYCPGFNMGVRLGRASKIKNHFLGVIDVDCKSANPKHAKEVENELSKWLNGSSKILPQVKSGRGNGSRHYHILTNTPVAPFKAAQSTEIVKVYMPSASPSKRELGALTAAEIAKGIRLRPAWEIGIMGEGQQVVLPPSIHCDSGKAYEWQKDFDIDAAKHFDASVLKKPEIPRPGIKSGIKHQVRGDEKNSEHALTNFEVIDLDLDWLPLGKKTKALIKDGDGVEDRSAALLIAANNLVRLGLNKNEVLSLLTDKENFLGGVSFEHAKTADRGRAAAWLYKYTVKKSFDEKSAENMFREPIKELTPLTFEVKAKAQTEMDTEHDWRADLAVTAKDGYQTTLRNVKIILENGVSKTFLKRDLFRYRDEYTTQVPWWENKNKKGKNVEDDDVKLCKLWFADEFGIEPKDSNISDAFDIVALRSAFDPVKDFLESLPEWDGVDRLDTWLEKNFEAEVNSPDAKEYYAQVFRKWMIALVARVYQPGLKFDWMPIFEGHQGIGKSSFGEMLCGKKYFLDSIPNLQDKDASLNLQGFWIVEFGELASFRKNEIEIIKSFITRTVDKLRPPYGRRLKEYERRCVFFGTTNNDKYLRDETGNRRFKPLKVGQLDFEALERDREQLFAESVWLYKYGFDNPARLEITGRAKVFEVQFQAEKMVQDDAEAMRLLIENFKDEKGPINFDFSRFQIVELFGGRGTTFKDLRPLKNWPCTNRNLQFAAKAVSALGGEKRKIQGRFYWNLSI